MWLPLLLAAASVPPFTGCQSHCSAKAQQVHESALVIGAHADTPQRFLDENLDVGSTDPKDHGHVGLDKVMTSNLGARLFSVGQAGNESGPLRDAYTRPDQLVQAAPRRSHDRSGLHATTSNARTNKTAALVVKDRDHRIENDSCVRDFLRSGVAYMTLSWSNTNEWADCSGDVNNPIKRHNGLQRIQQAGGA